MTWLLLYSQLKHQLTPEILVHGPKVHNFAFCTIMFHHIYIIPDLKVI